MIPIKQLQKFRKKCKDECITSEDCWKSTFNGRWMSAIETLAKRNKVERGKLQV